MALKDLIKRELHVVVHGQSSTFRIKKWVVIIALLVGLYYWKGIGVTVRFLIIAAILSLGIHFLFRWKTDGWTKSWGPYKRIKLNGE